MMSDTYRHTQPNWNPDHPDWPKDNRFHSQKPIQSLKHQRRDRHRRNCSKNWRFSKYCKNTYYNLKSKIYDLMLKESKE